MLSDQMAKEIEYAKLFFPEKWIQILIELDQKLSFYDPNYQILQIKDKFNALRVYVRVSDNVNPHGFECIQKAIQEAEDKSKQTERTHK